METLNLTWPSASISVTGFQKWGPLSKPGATSKQPPALELEVPHAKLIHVEAQLMCRPREHRPSQERLNIGKQRLLKSRSFFQYVERKA